MMECIIISSDEESDVQIIVEKLAKPPLKSELCDDDVSCSSSSNDDPIKIKKTAPVQIEKKVKNVSEEKLKFLSITSLAPVISLVDDCDESSSSEAQTNSKKVPEKIESSKEISNSFERLKSIDICKNEGNLNSGNDTDSDSNVEEEETIESNETYVKLLIELCRRAEYGEEMNVVERKILNYFRTASSAKVESQEFKAFLKNCISRIETILNSSKDKLLISRIIKEFLNEMKSDPNVVDGKLSKLYSLYRKLLKKIMKLEEADVESDEDGGNPYIYLDRYRKKAVDVYNKICELEGRSNDADRPTLQRFFFTGSTAPIPVQRALERYYNKTHIFPDFYDVKKLVKKVNKEENLNLSENEIQVTARTVFMEFGERLVWRRKYDDYNILVDYLREEECTDPADFDAELQNKLDQNRKSRKKEQEILDKFAVLEANNKTEDKTNKNGDNKLETEKIEEITINNSSSSSSLPSSPEHTNAEESDDSDRLQDGCKSSKLQNKEEIIIFSDSDEDFLILENKELAVTSNKRLINNSVCEPLDNYKRLKIADNVSSSNNTSAPVENGEIIEIDDVS